MIIKQLGKSGVTVPKGFFQRITKGRRMSYQLINNFINLLVDYGWHVQNADSSDLFYISGSEMVWDLINDDLHRTNTLVFFVIGDLGELSKKLKDIIYVTDNKGNRLIFEKDNLFEQIEFIKNL